MDLMHVLVTHGTAPCTRHLLQRPMKHPLSGSHLNIPVLALLDDSSSILEIIAMCLAEALEHASACQVHNGHSLIRHKLLGYRNGTVLNCAHGKIVTSAEFLHVLLLLQACVNLPLATQNHSNHRATILTKPPNRRSGAVALSTAARSSKAVK
jgi:hypothetical protein